MLSSKLKSLEKAISMRRITSYIMVEFFWADHLSCEGLGVFVNYQKS